MRPLIIGCGNDFRGDDAAGLLVARRMRQLGFEAREEAGGGLELLDAWSGAQCAIVVDAVVTGAAPGTVSRWGSDVTPPVAAGSSTHGIGLAEAIRLGRLLGRLPESLEVIGIEAKQFERGAPPSPEVLEAVERVAQELVQCMNRE